MRKAVLILGGSSGIGNSCVSLFEKMGWQVFATYFSHKKTNPPNSLVEWAYLDINDTELTQKFADALPPLDAIIFAVGKNNSAKTASIAEDVEQIFHTNVISQIKTVQLLKKKLRKGSSIIFFSSITARRGSAGRIPYSSSKSAIHGLVKSLAEDLAPSTRVNAICPGYIRTRQYVKNSSMSEKQRIKNIFVGRLGKPDEVAKLALFLSSEDGGYINAQTINVDGGIR